jgi:predicted chitinase
MNKQAFYAALRQRNSGVFGTSLSARQVEGIEALLDEGAHLPLSHLAHVLGEVHHETGGGMYPIKETVFRSHKNQNPTDAQVIARLDAAWAKGQLPWVQAPYWRGGFFGRGQIQLTHETNYRKFAPIVGANLVAHPSKALDLPVSARIAVMGCERGMFTGKRLADYDRPAGFDHMNARRVVNGFVLEQADQVTRAARAFEAALEAAGYRPAVAPIPDHVPASPAQKPGGLLGAIIKAIVAIFGARK